MSKINLAEKSILVTGASGFLGGAIIRNLVAHGIPREKIATPSREVYDFCKKEDCEKAVRGIDIIIHCAALTGNAELHRSKPADIFYINATMGMELLRAASLAGVQKFVTIGSVTEYPDTATSPLKESDLWNGLPEATHVAYSIAKRALLTYGQACRTQYGISVIHLLMTSMYGPGAAQGSGPIPSFIERISEAQKNNNKSITAWGTGKALRDFLFVEDAAEGIILATQEYEGAEAVNMGSGHEVSIKDLVALICRLMNYDGEIVWDATKPDGRLRRQLDVQGAKDAFGFVAKTQLENGLRETIAWYNSTHE